MINKSSKEILLLTLFVYAVSIGSCKKHNSLEAEETTFKLASPEINADSLLPKEYTCDGESSTLPLEWSNVPLSTKFFALIMHHEASPDDIHWYWLLYNIPASIHSLTKNSTGIGTLGNNSVNGKTEYAPPCSKGPGIKRYIYTIYALTDSVRISIPAAEVNREILLAAIKNITITSATLTVIYSR